ncbi:outer membrane beta-barrel protein [Helicobacter suis]|uniref:outer membrane beta-barrel protein n=1 Tax=Helicobacter suis TaxID=104628 RepID=UPI00248FD531|nr:outer membrane beta-barrel protein [Helicobacter suis]
MRIFLSVLVLLKIQASPLPVLQDTNSDVIFKQATPDIETNHVNPTPLKQTPQEIQKEATQKANQEATEKTQEAKRLDAQIKILQEQIKNQAAQTKPSLQQKRSKMSQRTQKKKAMNYKISKQKSGFFLGVGYGVGIIHESYNSQQANSTSLGIAQNQEIFTTLPNLSGVANMANLELGYQQYFSPYFGSRVYGDLLFIPGFASFDQLNNAPSKNLGSFFYALGSLDMDLLLDAPLERQKKHFLGLYAGFGVGLMVLRDQSGKAFQGILANGYTSPNALWKMLVQVDYTVNLGIAFTYNRNLRFEVGTKIPLTYLRLGFETPATYKSSTNSQTLISQDTGFKRSTLLVMNVLYVF